MTLFTLMYTTIECMRGVNTGLRISEFVGLTISDIDFDNMVINVDHQLVRVYNEKKAYIIQKTKQQPVCEKFL